MKSKLTWTLIPVCLAISVFAVMAHANFSAGTYFLLIALYLHTALKDTTK